MVVWRIVRLAVIRERINNGTVDKIAAISGPNLGHIKTISNIRTPANPSLCRASTWDVMSLRTRRVL